VCAAPRDRVGTLNHESVTCVSERQTDRDGGTEGGLCKDEWGESNPMLCCESTIKTTRTLTAGHPLVGAPVECACATLVDNAGVTAPDQSAIPVQSERQIEAWERQIESREVERKLRKRVVAFSRWSQQRGETVTTAAAAVDVSVRTLQRWRRGWRIDRLAPRPRGRPCQCAMPEVRQDVVAFLDATGPATGLPALRDRYPHVARAELVELLTDYRGDWRLAHAREQSELHWLRAGSVWAIDFSHPPHDIDDSFPAIFAVRDLASHQQLLWLPVEDETADTVIDALHALFEEYGAPLVLKCDNGSAFVARDTKQFLCDWSVIPLYSPPYAPWYNGTIERANRRLKEETAFLAEKAGHPGYWTSADLHRARLESNRLARPAGADGPTAEEVWESRVLLSMDERDTLFENLEARRRAVCREREVDPDVPLAHHLETEIVRLALQPVLENLSYLHITRRRIAPAINRRKRDRIV